MLKKISSKELIWYGASIVIFLVGFVFLILGIVGDNLSVNSTLRKLQAAFPWRYIGLIIVAGAVIFFIIILLVNAKKVDRVYDREQRRKLRLQAMYTDTKKEEETIVVNQQGKIEEAKKVETIDSTVTNTEPNKTIESNNNSVIENAVISDDIKGENK